MIAGTVVVTGEPDFISGKENQNKIKQADVARAEEVAKPHPLDD